MKKLDLSQLMLKHRQNKLDTSVIEQIALASVINPEYDAQYRRICRWFSKEFSTPLPEVEENLETSYVLLHYFEHNFARLKESRDDSPAALSMWTDTYNRIIDPENYEASSAAEDREDDEWAEEMKREIEAEEEARKAKEAEELAEQEKLNLKEEVIASRSGETTPPNFPKG